MTLYCFGSLRISKEVPDTVGTPPSPLRRNSTTRKGSVQEVQQVLVRLLPIPSVSLDLRSLSCWVPFVTLPSFVVSGLLRSFFSLVLPYVSFPYSLPYPLEEVFRSH